MYSGFAEFIHEKFCVVLTAILGLQMISIAKKIQ